MFFPPVLKILFWKQTHKHTKRVFFGTKRNSVQLQDSRMRRTHTKLTYKLILSSTKDQSLPKKAAQMRATHEIKSQATNDVGWNRGGKMRGWLFTYFCLFRRISSENMSFVELAEQILRIFPVPTQLRRNWVILASAVWRNSDGLHFGASIFYRDPSWWGCQRGVLCPCI